ncbi:hypothetical protein CYLTODRAFT_449559 [Cylindrobasidium torrendii FP15055 ss-10]|uniref:Uncharacterized protein n=1 Tax=Cylindrobasidium torrendii FP15055 ss-10 TaxID=1314674 RepID=A0A0D7BRM8_9AGAR|nr:hypothetical protein CYLTODRAFT_449559 [Cylindrobasidium torrendii FP15055 ss-10]
MDTLQVATPVASRKSPCSSPCPSPAIPGAWPPTPVPVHRKLPAIPLPPPPTEIQTNPAPSTSSVNHVANFQRRLSIGLAEPHNASNATYNDPPFLLAGECDTMTSWPSDSTCLSDSNNSKAGTLFFFACLVFDHGTGLRIHAHKSRFPASSHVLNEDPYAGVNDFSSLPTPSSTCSLSPIFFSAPAMPMAVSRTSTMSSSMVLDSSLSQPQNIELRGGASPSRRDGRDRLSTASEIARTEDALATSTRPSFYTTTTLPVGPSHLDWTLSLSAQAPSIAAQSTAPTTPADSPTRSLSPTPSFSAQLLRDATEHVVNLPPSLSASIYQQTSAASLRNGRDQESEHYNDLLPDTSTVAYASEVVSSAWRFQEQHPITPTGAFDAYHSPEVQSLLSRRQSIGKKSMATRIKKLGSKMKWMWGKKGGKTASCDDLRKQKSNPPTIRVTRVAHAEESPRLPSLQFDTEREDINANLERLEHSGTQRSQPRDSGSARGQPSTAPKTPPSPPRPRRSTTSPGQRLFTVSTQARARPATPGASPSRLIAHRRPVSARLALPVRHSILVQEDAVVQQRPAVTRRVSKVDPPGLEVPPLTRGSFSEPTQIQEEMPASESQACTTENSTRRVKKNRRFSLPILLGASRMDWE